MDLRGYSVFSGRCSVNFNSDSRFGNGSVKSDLRWSSYRFKKKNGQLKPDSVWWKRKINFDLIFGQGNQLDSIKMAHTKTHKHWIETNLIPNLVKNQKFIELKSSTENFKLKSFDIKEMSHTVAFSLTCCYFVKIICKINEPELEDNNNIANINDEQIFHLVVKVSFMFWLENHVGEKCSHIILGLKWMVNYYFWIEKCGNVFFMENRDIQSWRHLLYDWNYSLL